MTPRRRTITLWLLALAALATASNPCRGQPIAAPAGAALTLPAEWLKTLTWRSIGPATMGGRIVALAVCATDPSTYWVATASGGLLKTTNNGVTFEHQFDRESTVSLGDVAVAPSDCNIVWVGTGENNPRNSVSYGDGVYRSSDGGKSWKNVGLKQSFQIGRIAIHPKNPDVVYVGALGRLYGPSQERGLYKTTDGGKTWSRVLFINDKTGVIDVQMNPAEPETLLVATYERQRDGYDFNDPDKKWAAGSGLHKTVDGGKTWTKVTKGLPTCKLGRIGLDYYRKDPRTVFAVVESEKIGSGPPQLAAGMAYLGISGQDNRGAELLSVSRGGPADKAGLRPGDVIVSVGDKVVRSYAGLLAVVRNHKAGDTVKVGRRRDQMVAVVNLTFGGRPGSAVPPGRPFTVALGGQRENIQDRQGPNGFEYGGVYKSTDGGDSWARVNSLNPRPMYFSQVRVDPNDERFVYVLGVALHRSTDGGRTFQPDGGRRVHADHHALWIDRRDGRHMIVGGDGGFYVTYDRMNSWDHLNTMAIGQFYHVDVDPRRNYWVYGGLQDNGSWGGPSFTRTLTGPVNEDWIRVSGGDGFTCRVDPTDSDQVYFTSQYGGLARRNFRTRTSARLKPQAPRGQPAYRFNWNTPFLLSHHDPRVYYCGGNYVFRSAERGSNARVISPEITATNRGSASALAESPRNKSVLYAGTDDGFLWVTRDGGKQWTNVTRKLGLPGLRWVSSIEASRFEEGRAYVVFDGHRSDDDRPYVLVTEDFGKTWKALHGGLPGWGTTRVLREDVENRNLLYLGTEFALWASLDRGRTWQKLNNNLPTVAIHEIAVHPTAGEIVAATHGRSLWVLDVSALRQFTPESVEAKAHLYKPLSAIRWATEPSRGGTNRSFAGENPPRGAPLYYSLGEKAQQVGLKVVDVNGKVVRELSVSKEKGLHRAVWHLAGPGRAGGAGRPPRPGFGARGGRPVPPGTYRVVLSVDGVEQTQPLKVEADPTAPQAGIALEEEQKRAAGERGKAGEVLDD